MEDQNSVTDTAQNARDDVCLFFFNDTATTEIYTLSLHDALPIFSFAASPRLVIRTHVSFTPPADNLCLASSSGWEGHHRRSRPPRAWSWEGCTGTCGTPCTSPWLP